MGSQEIKEGYKLTEVGVIPEDWEVTSLNNVIQLINGFAFKSEFFSENGPIVLTPGNFSLNGGLYFTDKNTKRFSGSFPSFARFDYGDLVIVMTDLTTECNLLGKPAFINIKEPILHNQRIGKVKTLMSNISKPFLYYFFLSSYYHLKVKQSATGSTVRHTYPKHIYSIKIPCPPLHEQEKIAQVLSDFDSAIAHLDKLISKKRNVKQGTMQQLLTGKKRLPGFSGEWEVKKQKEIVKYINGRAFKKSEWKNYGIPVVRLQNLTGSGNEYYFSNLELPESQYIYNGDLIFMWSASFGPYIWKGNKAIYHYHIWKIESNIHCVDKTFYFYKLLELTNFLKNQSNGSTMLHITKSMMEEYSLTIPNSIKEQKAIAQILIDMDAEIEALEKKRNKYQAIKQGMMQELLTGKTRLK